MARKKTAKPKHVIAYAVDQYALACGSCDIEYTICHMTSGRRRTFEDGDPELEAFFEDQEKYWRDRGWRRAKVEGGWTLVPKTMKVTV